MGQTWKGNTFHDRFTLDFECDTFTWEKDGKVTYANKIISHTAKYDHHSFTMGQIAAKLHLNRSTVCRTLQRARERLYACLRYTL